MPLLKDNLISTNMLYKLMKTLIINADDFGMCREANKGILFCHTHGVVSSASLMANMPGFEEAAKMLKKYPGLDAGVHLNLTWGKPLTKAKSLVDETGNFRQDMIKRILLGKFEKSDVEEEIKAQIQLCKKHAKISHVNSHKHFHVLPSVMKTIVDIAKEEGIKWIRLPKERIPAKINRQLPKLMLLRFYSLSAQRYYDRLGLKYADKFIGVSHTGNLTLESFKNLLSHVNEGITEIICHPGYKSNAVKNDRLAVSREKELRILTNKEAKESIKKYGIRLSGFRGLK